MKAQLELLHWHKILLPLMMHSLMVILTTNTLHSIADLMIMMDFLFILQKDLYGLINSSQSYHTFIANKKVSHLQPIQIKYTLIRSTAKGRSSPQIHCVIQHNYISNTP